MLCISVRIISLECENALGSYQTVVSNLTGNFVMLFVQMKKLKNLLKKHFLDSFQKYARLLVYKSCWKKNLTHRTTLNFVLLLLRNKFAKSGLNTNRISLDEGWRGGHFTALLISNKCYLM